MLTSDKNPTPCMCDSYRKVWPFVFEVNQLFEKLAEGQETVVEGIGPTMRAAAVPSNQISLESMRSL